MGDSMLVSAEVKEGILIYVDLDGVLLNPERQCLFEDVLPFLKAFGPSQLVLVSSGDRGAQTAKIKASGLEPYFHAVRIVHRKVDAVDPQNKTPAFFVSSSPRAIRDIKKECSWVFCIQVRKPLVPEEQLYGADMDDFCFSSLVGLAKFIKEYRPR